MRLELQRKDRVQRRWLRSRSSDPKPPAEGMDIGGFLREGLPEAEPPDKNETAPWEGHGRIPARVSFVTLAVRDFARMAKFYRQFGWPESKDSNEEFVAFQTGGAIRSGPMSYLAGDKQYVAVAGGHALFVFSLD